MKKEIKEITFNLAKSNLDYANSEIEKLKQWIIDLEAILKAISDLLNSGSPLSLYDRPKLKIRHTEYSDDLTAKKGYLDNWEKSKETLEQPQYEKAKAKYDADTKVCNENFDAVFEKAKVVAEKIESVRRHNQSNDVKTIITMYPNQLQSQEFKNTTYETLVVLLNKAKTEFKLTT